MVLKIVVIIGLSLWVGGVAGRFLGFRFPPADRWACFWGAVTLGTLLLFFLNRHLVFSSLVFEFPVALMFFLTFHATFILHPQIRELKRKLNLPEFQQTAHQQTMQFSFNRLHRRSVLYHLLILLLGLLSLGLIPPFLR